MFAVMFYNPGGYFAFAVLSPEGWAETCTYAGFHLPLQVAHPAIVLVTVWTDIRDTLALKHRGRRCRQR